MNAPVVLIPENPMPSGGEARWLTASDGVRLRVIVWPRETARGTVFLFGGRTEFAEKYFEVAGELLDRGFAVATFDWRGQGLSDRADGDERLGHVGCFASFDRDLATFMGEVAPPLPKPWIALAHSMGGNIVLRGIHDHPEWFSACALSAPMLGLRLGSRAARLVAHLVAVAASHLGWARHYAPGGNRKGADEIPFADNILTRDEKRYGVYQALIRAQPKLGLGSASFGWLAAAFGSIAVTGAPSFLKAITTPVLIAIAGDDALIDRASLVRAAKYLPGGEMVTIENARHEILIETDACRQAFWVAFDDFIRRHVPASDGL